MLNSINNVHTLFDDIDNLLKDLCEFLSENIKDGNISEKHKHLAQQLVERSKKQLQNISVVTATLSKTQPEEDESYVDMTPAKDPAIEEAPPIVQLRHPVIEAPRMCPYISHSIHEIKDFDHGGYLDRKGKLFFLDHHVKQFVVVKDGWMLIYSRENDKKPSDVIDLQKTIVKYVEYYKDGACQRDQKSFQLVTDTKTLQFMGKNGKDMEQWITIISKSAQFGHEEVDKAGEQKNGSDPTPKIISKPKKELPNSLPKMPPIDREGYIKKPLPITPPVQGEEGEETYDEIIHPPEVVIKSPIKSNISDPTEEYDSVNITDSPTEEENIYESPESVISTIHKNNSNKPSPYFGVPPPLPPVNPRSPHFKMEQKAQPPPPVPRDQPKSRGLQKEEQVSSNSDDGDEVEYYEPLNEKEEIVKSPKSPKNLPPANQNINVNESNDSDEEQVYDVLQNGKEPTIKPKQQPSTPANAQKSFLFRISQISKKESPAIRDSSFSDDEQTDYDIPINLKQESAVATKVPPVDKADYVKNLAISTQSTDNDETYDEIQHPNVNVTQVARVAQVSRVAQVARVAQGAKVAPPRAPRPPVPERKPSDTKRTAF